jgi:hypothetical protein
MSDTREQYVGTVTAIHRFPVKSMLGEFCQTATVTARGVAGDRAWAVLDATTGKVASAKRPQYWRALLRCAAATVEAAGRPGPVRITMPDGTTLTAGDPDIDRLLSALTGRAVRLVNVPPAAAKLDRSVPEAVLDQGLDAEVDSIVLQMGQGAPAGTFVDYAPLHLLTTASLHALDSAIEGEPIEPIRYRPNVIIASPEGSPRFVENAWLGGSVRIGEAVMLRVILPTPRCAIPTLAHGALPSRPEALLAPVAQNRLDVEGFGNLPCAGVYVDVRQEGAIRVGDQVMFSPA